MARRYIETPADVLVEFGIAAVDGDAMARDAEAASTCSTAKRSRHAEVHDCAARDPAHWRDRPDVECVDNASSRHLDGGAPDHLTPARAPASAAARQGALLPPEALALLDALGHGPVPVDLLAARAGIAADALPHLLLLLDWPAAWRACPATATSGSTRPPPRPPRPRRMPCYIPAMRRNPRHHHPARNRDARAEPRYRRRSDRRAPP